MTTKRDRRTSGIWIVSVTLLLAWTVFVGAVHAQRASPSSVSDPYQMSIGNGEPTASIPSNPGYKNTNGRSIRSSVLPNPSTTLVLIIPGQSLAASSATGTAIVPTNDAHVFNFNINDGGEYPCRNPVLGAAQAVFVPLPFNSPGCSIGDALVTAGTFTDVVVVPIAIGGTTVANLAAGGDIYNRIFVTMGQLARHNLTGPTGFPGTVYIDLHIGETDAGNGTARAAFAAGLRTMAANFVAAGSGSANFFIATESQCGVGATFTGTGSGTNLTVSAVTGTIGLGGNTIVGTGVPANTHILSQTSGVAGLAGVYVTDNATTSVGAALVANATTLNIVNGQADAVASGCPTCRAGANWDTAIPPTGTNRQSDGCHLNAPPVGNGLPMGVAADVTVITNCKNTSCYMIMFGAFGLRRRRPCNDDNYAMHRTAA